MASHSQSHHHQCHPSTTTTTCFCCHCSTTSHHPSPPEQQPLFIHCQSHISQQPHHSHYSQSPLLQNPKPHFQSLRRHDHFQENQEISHTVISSLLRRISALESSVQRTSSFTLRDAAARTIQTHFRAFLVYRSRTLRQLKDLAFIKSALNALKLNHSNNTRSDSRALSLKALNLLNKLEFIQGSDPMIRDAKRSINKELIRFMDYLDELSVKRHQLSTRVVKNLRIGVSGTKSRGFSSDQRGSSSEARGLREDGERELLEKLRKRVEKMEGARAFEEDEELDNVEDENSRLYVNGKRGVERVRNGVLMKRQAGAPSKAKKSVRFAENGNVYMVYKGSNGPVSFVECHSNDGSDSVDAEEMGREIEEIGTGDDEEEDEESPQISDDDDGRESRRNVVAESDNESSGHEPIENEDGSFVFSAPLPVKMEPRADLMNKKSLKIIN
ncbi:BAG family molecular chaperone regulator 8, chloroplastic [Apium graveolens]|uniref:BAG family molecular chaperone regulator 8, chloroplastic n=1 Tax=Apium graveolens TaxID=4045 RepID=UPI003D7AAFD8